MVYQQVYLVMETKNIHCLGLNKPNKPVYFSMHSLTGQWDSVRFIGLFGLFFHVYFSMRSLNKPNKPVYFSMRSLTGHQDSVRFIGLFGLLVYFSISQEL